MSTLHVTNWASRRLHGPGRKFTIMASPRHWERGEGRVLELTPRLSDLADVQNDAISFEEYRRRFLLEAGRWDLAEGSLRARLWAEERFERVKDGDTLCCACSREHAAAGECHRVWSAELCRRAGWDVLLDGQKLEGVDEDWAPVFGAGEDGE